MSTVCFATKCYEKDWRKMTYDFKNKMKSCHYPFDSSLLVINNVRDEDVVKNALSGVSEHLISVKSVLNDVLSSFNLEMSDFIEPTTGQDGFLYAIGELCAVYCTSKYDYLCFVQGDCIIYPASDWVTEAVEILENNPNISVVSPYSEVNTWGDLDQYMSDQAFVVRVSEFNQPIYNFKEVSNPDYPDYGGRSFEYMVGQYLVEAKKWRRILKTSYVIHG